MNAIASSSRLWSHQLSVCRQTFSTSTLKYNFPPNYSPPTPSYNYGFGSKGKGNAKAKETLEMEIKTGSNSTLRATTWDHKGNIINPDYQLNKQTIIQKFQLNPRDLRKLTSSSGVPEILVRQNSGAILISILHLRLIIKKDSVTLFDSASSQDSYLKGLFCFQLEYNLKLSEAATHGLPYEFRALESCLQSVVSALEGEMRNLRDLVLELLDDLESNIERDKLLLLLQYSRKLGSFQSRATAIQSCLTTILASDEDLAAAYLTSPPGNATVRKLEDHEMAELLLESYEMRVEEIVVEVTVLINNVESTGAIVELILDSNRNELLVLGLRCSIVTIGLTTTSVIAGVFGMNLLNTLETQSSAFPIVVATLVVTGSALTLAGLRKLRNLQKIGLVERVRGSSWKLLGDRKR